MGRSMSALLFLPLMASAEVITFEMQPEQDRQAFVDMAFRSPSGSAVTPWSAAAGVSGLGGPGGIADPCASPAAYLSANVTSTVKSPIDVRIMNYQYWAFEWTAQGDSAGVGTRLWWGRMRRFREVTQRSYLGFPGPARATSVTPVTANAPTSVPAKADFATVPSVALGTVLYPEEASFRTTWSPRSSPPPSKLTTKMNDVRQRTG